MFEVNVWRNIYNKVQLLGKYLIDSRPDKDGNPPAFKISLEERFEVEEQIKRLTSQSNNYLNRCGMRMPSPKWHYSIKDETTWASSDKFEYPHLLSEPSPQEFAA